VSNPIRRAIPTIYNGTHFRSKLEADWARSFDTLGIEWEYEKVGQYFGNTFYYPDFFLPKSRQYVEVKGVFQPDDCKKVQALLNHAKPRPFTGEWCPDITIVACVPGGVFYGWERTDVPAETWYDFLTKQARRVELFACTECRGWWFAVADESFKCQCCGAYDGNHHLASAVPSPLPDFPNVNALHFLVPA
jgi:hypothetical protein